MKISRELLKGTTGLLVLRVISEGDMYGYQIAQLIKNRSGEAIVLNEGSLYPILHAYEKKGYLTAYRDGTEGGRERRYYHITPAGTAFLLAHTEEWGYFTEAVNQVLRGEEA